MPKYLAKDYLNQYVQHSADFLRYMLLNTTNEFEYPLSFIDDNAFYVVTEATTLSKELFTEENNIHISTGNFKFHVENYEDCPEHQNIVQIDSDLDCEINSSYGSSIDGISASIKSEVLKSILVPTLCSKELNLSKLLLEEIEYGIENHSSASLLSLISCLRPVKVLDPFTLPYFTGLSKLVLEFVPSESFDQVSKEVLKFEKDLLSENGDMFLCENYIMENMFEDPLLDLKNYLNSILDVSVTVSEDTLKWFYSDLFAYNCSMFELFDGEINITTDSMKPMKIQTSVNKNLESPLSDVESVYGSFMELPDMNLHAENLMIDVLNILTPKSKLKAEKSLRDADKRYDEKLLLLLPVLEEPVFQSETFSLPPVKYFKESKLNDDSLEWDPLFNFGREMKLAEESLVTTLNSETLSNIFTFTFSKEIIPNDDEENVIDWMFAGRKFLTLQHLTFQSENIKYTNDVKNNAMDLVTKKANIIDFNTNEGNSIDFNKKEENKLSFTKYLKIKKPETTKGEVKMMCTSPKVYQSPLDSFMMLRTGRFDPLPSTKKVKAFVKPALCTVSAVKVQPMSIECNNSINQRNINNSEHIAQHNVSNCEAKHNSKSHQLKDNCNLDITCPKNSLSHQTSAVASLNTNATLILDVFLSSEYISILNTLERESWSILLDLKNLHLIGKSMNFFNISPDFSRFLLKQEEQKVEKDLHIFSIVCTLHGLVQAANLIANCSVEVACGFLKVFGQEKKAILMNNLDHLQIKLAKFHFQNEKANNFHPKFISIHKLIVNWLKNDLNSKIIILFHRYYENLSHCLKAFLGTDKALNVNLYPQQNICEEDYISTFLNANVILAAENEDMLTCPWQYFQFVIQFEHRLESQWHDLIFESNPELQQFVSLNVLTNSSQESSLCNGIVEMNSYMNHGYKKKDKLSNLADPISIYTQHYVLCCNNVVKNNELLIALESKENLIVVTKDYSKLKCVTDFCFHPDILIDERTGILILNANDLTCVMQVDFKILSMALKCSVFHVILTSYLNDVLDSTNICPQIVVMIAKVMEQFKVTVKLHYVFSVQQFASLVRLLCDNAKQISTVWDKEQWLSRQWLREDISKEEEFLLSFPFINSFCAQIIVKAVDSLSDLMKYSLHELRVLLKCIPQRIIEAFYNASHNVEEFFHQPEFIVQKSLTTTNIFASNDRKINLLDNNNISLLFDTPVSNEISKNCKENNSQTEMPQENTSQTRKNNSVTLEQSSNHQKSLFNSRPDSQFNYQLPHEIKYLQHEINKQPHKINYKQDEIKHMQHKGNELPHNLNHLTHGISYLPHQVVDLPQEINHLQHKTKHLDAKYMSQEINYHHYEINPVTFKNSQCLKEKKSQPAEKKFTFFETPYTNETQTNDFKKLGSNWSVNWNTSENDSFKSDDDSQSAADASQICKLKPSQKDLINSERKLKQQNEKFTNKAEDYNSHFFSFNLTSPQSDSNFLKLFKTPSQSDSNFYKVNSQMHSQNSFLNSSLYSSKNQTTAESFKQNSKENCISIKNFNSCKPLWRQPLNQCNNSRNVPRQAVKAIQVHRSQISNFNEVDFCKSSKLNSKDYINRKHTASQPFSMIPQENSSSFLNSDEEISYLKTKKRKLSYERVPGATNGQTRLTFL
ncbi:protein shortage in chiasmata 1 ortholog isoform X1 [Hydra vulgaris]|uniref:protein shortage in chiasmata 1 ortholog isoform X1 n=2 Tax=Hydra vulgaris TaxID=6087 RepID=UPI001F5E9856|nr:protein shortage in chiasmata 1 ortholog [Hydra vulgaris]